MIAIIDYGLGNVNAFFNYFKRSNIKCCLAQQAKDLEEAKKIILPGVGSFDGAMKKFNESGMRDVVESKIFEDNCPILGVCVGMQIMFECSEEGDLEGLGWINGSVKKIIKKNESMRLPHMGWNSIEVINKDDVLNNLNQSFFYFLHSYYVSPANQDNIISTTTYGDIFPSVIKKNNIYGIQCHPEKSHSNGATFLKNFSNLKC